MPISYPDAFTIEKNQLESVVPFAYLFHLRIRDSVSPDTYTHLYHTNFDQNITFNSSTFIPFPIKLGSLEQNISGEIRKMSVTIANVDQAVISLLETYWASVVDPLWIVKTWIVDTVNPANTPVNNFEEYEVISATTNLISTTFDMRTDGISLTKIVPGRNYVRPAFSNIPRRIR